MLPILYNSNYQIVQTQDLRNDPCRNGSRRANHSNRQESSLNHHFEKWMGDSVGYWEGDTLVVKTQNFHSQQSFRGSSDQLVITERFSLQNEGKIKYAFTLEDSLSYRQPLDR